VVCDDDKHIIKVNNKTETLIAVDFYNLLYDYEFQLESSVVGACELRKKQTALIK
jgi:flagellar assembly factor FliW